MKVWVLIVFGFNLNYMTLEKQEFFTQRACIEAALVVQKSINAVKGTPVSKMTNVDCIEDTKP